MIFLNYILLNNQIQFNAEYEQNFPHFTPNLSIIDSLFNLGFEGTTRIIK